MAKEALRRSAWTWIFSFIAPYLVSRSYDPINFVNQISPRPVYFIHGDKDHIVPVHMSEDLYKEAKSPKRIMIVNGADHLDCHRVLGKEYYNAIGDFFSKALTGNEEK